MNRRQALLSLAPLALRAQDRDVEGATLDRVYQALEKMTSRSAGGDLNDAVKDLRFALDQNGSYGDAHYYLSLCYRQLNQPRLAEQALGRARLYASRALADARDPFRVAVPPRTELVSDARVGQKWALLVGINRFRTPGARPLTFAVADARDVGLTLADPKVGRFPATQITTLTDEQATTVNIRAALNRICRLSRPGDIVFVFLSSHGTSRDMDHQQANYIVTYDTDLSGPDALFGTALPMVEVSEIIRTRCLAQRTIVMLDTCHSGGALQVAGRAAPPCVVSAQEVNRFREGAGRYILTASQADERSYESAGNGYFTRAFLHALARSQGCLPLTRIFAQVQREVSERVSREIGKKQTPSLGQSDQAVDIRLGAPDCQLA
ncbi:MAG: caspase family protein [Bryobacteraceae bacterium]|nr:caspase family protein [Bryobacteraceae bacterium]